MWNSETGKMRVGIEIRAAFALGESMLFGKLGLREIAFMMGGDKKRGL